MDRRDIFGAIVALWAAGFPLAVPGQPRKAAKVFRIGIATDFDSPEMRRRFYGSPAEEVARKVLALAPDVVVVATTGYTIALHRLTKTIPIVMWASGYPVEAGVAVSLARPGKNVTGNSLYAGTRVWGKLVELLREASPGAKQVGVLWGYVAPFHPAEEVEPCYREIREAGRALRLEIDIAEIARTEQVQPALAAFEAKKVDALLMTSGPALWFTRQAILKYASGRRMPTIADFAQPPDSVAERPLLSYAPSWDDLLRQTASYVDRILRGAKPGDLPIQQPARFELEVNLRTAKVLGLKIPLSILLRASRVNE